MNSYSPDLSQCDYYVFPKLQTTIKEAICNDTETIQAGVIQALRNIPLFDTKQSMLKLVDPFNQQEFIQKPTF